MNTCPATIHRTDRAGKHRATICGGWLAFIGISVTRSFGWRHWSQCQSPYCGLYVARNESGMVAFIQKTEPSRHLFHSDRQG